MNLGRLNHVGVATPSIEKSVALYRDLLGATKIHDAFDLPAQGVRVCFVDAPNSQIELIEPLGPDSPIVKFLAKNPQPIKAPFILISPPRPATRREPEVSVAPDRPQRRR